MRLTLGLNALLYFLNAILWAWVAKQPGIAVMWGSVAVANLWYIKKLVNEGVW